MSNWFIGKHFLEKERRELKRVAARRESNNLQIKVAQSKLGQELIRELSGPKGLSLSFGAGCAAVLAFKNREHLGSLKELPWSDILQLAQEYGAASQERTHDAAQTRPPADSQVS